MYSFQTFRTNAVRDSKTVAGVSRDELDVLRMLPRCPNSVEGEVVLQDRSALGSLPRSGGPAQGIQEEEGGINEVAVDQDFGVVASIVIQVLETAQKVAAASEAPGASIPTQCAKLHTPILGVSLGPGLLDWRAVS